MINLISDMTLTITQKCIHRKVSHTIVFNSEEIEKGFIKRSWLNMLSSNKEKVRMIENICTYMCI